MAYQPQVRALVLVDRVYTDKVSGKHVLAGTFSNVSSAVFPTAWNQGAALYCAITDVRKDVAVTLAFHEASSDTVLFESTQPLPLKAGTDPFRTFELVFSLPPLPLPTPGKYEFVVSLASGERLASLPISATQVSAPENPA